MAPISVVLQPRVSSRRSLLSSPVDHSEQSPFVALPRGIAVLCGGQSQQGNTMYNAAVNKWSHLPLMPIVITDTSALYCDKSSYAFGGGSTRVFCLHLPSLKWNEKPKQLLSDHWPIAVAIDADIILYIISQNKCQNYNTCSLFGHINVTSH